MLQYQKLLREIIDHGKMRPNRTGIDTLGIFGAQLRFNDIGRNFPLVTTKKIHWTSVVEELLWIISGGTNANDLAKRGVNIWKQWAMPDGELGPIYGKQWRRWAAADGDIDQLANVIARIKSNPECRRLIVTAWNPADISKMKLPPCHSFFQFYVDNLHTDGLRSLSCHLTMRSADMFLGVPFNIASYALLTKLVAHAADIPFLGDLIISIGDAHIYSNHIEQVKEQLYRSPLRHPKVTLRADTPKDIDLITSEHIQLFDYNPHPTIKGEVAV